MPASYEMSWIPKLRRWSKMYRGQCYVFSCRQLGTPETKEGSYKAANEWWRKKLAEIEGNDMQALVEPILRTLEEDKAREQEQGLDTSALNFTLDHFKTDPLGDIMPKLVPFVFGKEYASHKPAPTDETVAFHVARFLELENARVKSGQVSLVQFDLPMNSQSGQGSVAGFAELV